MPGPSPTPLFCPHSLTPQNLHKREGDRETVAVLTSRLEQERILTASGVLCRRWPGAVRTPRCERGARWEEGLHCTGLLGSSPSASPVQRSTQPHLGQQRRWSVVGPGRGDSTQHPRSQSRC